MSEQNSNGTIRYDKITRPVVVQANYIASRKDKHWVDDFISDYTGCMPWNWGTPPISHTEVGFWLDGDLWFFSSTSRKELGGKNGTRWIKGNELLRNPKRWKLQENKFDICNGADYEIRIEIYRANDLIGLEYDFYGVGADFINPLRVMFAHYTVIEVIKKLKKIYCSKAVHAVETGKLAVYSPRRQYKWAKNNEFEDIKDTAAYVAKETIKSRV